MILYRADIRLRVCRENVKYEEIALSHGDELPIPTVLDDTDVTPFYDLARHRTEL